MPFTRFLPTLLILMLAACGQTGPLYLPKDAPRYYGEPAPEPPKAKEKPSKPKPPPIPEKKPEPPAEQK